MKKPSVLFIGCVVYLLIFSFLLWNRVALHRQDIYTGDADAYHRGAVNLTQYGMYSLNGVTPYIEREMGMSFFLAATYFFAGTNNPLVTLSLQGLLYLCSACFFVTALKKHTTARISHLTFFFLILAPSIFHAELTFYREGLTLSLFLLFATAFLHFLDRASWRAASLTGLFLGLIIFTYIPFLFLPLFLLGFFWLFSLPKKYLTVVLGIPFVILCAWGTRNYLLDGRFRLTDTYRTAVMLYARAEQAEQVHGLEPYRCLYAEYISRDWSNRSPACSTTRLSHVLWPKGPRGDEMQIAAESKKKILRYFPYYVWYSVSEVVELHLPFVNGWGRSYNILAMFYQVMLFVGCAMALRVSSGKHSAFLLMLILYSTALFSLTDATPRYHLPTLFCYITFAAVGYDALLKRLRHL